MSSVTTLVTLGLMVALDLVAGHGAIINAVGDAGGQGMALGVDTSTPRDGTRRDPFQQDSTRFRGDAADSVGETLGAGDNDIEAGTQAIMAETGDQLPQISAGGEVEMTLHQVNGDGGGPYTCMINDDGTGETWVAIDVTTTPPGRNSRNRQGSATDFPLVASIPDDQSCTGEVAGQDNVCLVRCQNAARAGPFGGVVPVQMAGTATANDARRRLARSIKVRRADDEEDFEDEEDIADEHELDDDDDDDDDEGDEGAERDVDGEAEFEEEEGIEDEHELEDDEVAKREVDEAGFEEEEDIEDEHELEDDEEA